MNTHLVRQNQDVAEEMSGLNNGLNKRASGVSVAFKIDALEVKGVMVEVGCGPREFGWRPLSRLISGLFNTAFTR